MAVLEEVEVSSMLNVGVTVVESPYMRVGTGVYDETLSMFVVHPLDAIMFRYQNDFDARLKAVEEYFVYKAEAKFKVLTRKLGRKVVTHYPMPNATAGATLCFLSTGSLVMANSSMSADLEQVTCYDCYRLASKKFF